MLVRLLPMFNRIRKLGNNIKETSRKYDISRRIKDEMVVVNHLSTLQHTQVYPKQLYPS